MPLHQMVEAAPGASARRPIRNVASQLPDALEPTATAVLGVHSGVAAEKAGGLTVVYASPNDQVGVVTVPVMYPPISSLSEELRLPSVTMYPPGTLTSGIAAVMVTAAPVGTDVVAAP